MPQCHQYKQHDSSCIQSSSHKIAVLLHVAPRDVTVNFGTFECLYRHRMVFNAIARFMK